MKKIFTFLCIAFASRGIGQITFLPNINTEWHYAFNHAFTDLVTNEKVKYERDSVIGAEKVKVVSHSKYYATCNTPGNYITLFKTRNDTVFFRSEITNHQWQIYTDFTAIAGHSWLTTFKSPNGAFSTYTITIDSSKTTLINSTPVIFMKGKINGGGSVTFYERIGNPYFLFYFQHNFSAACDGDYPGGLLCYEDSTLGLKQFTLRPCGYSVTPVEESDADSIVSVFPNPATDEVIIRNKKLSSKCTLTLVDITGRKLREWESIFQSGELKIMIKDIRSGLYFLRIRDEEKIIATKKIMKE